MGRKRTNTFRLQNRLFALLQEVDPPGVENGVMVDPKTYFFWLINRRPDQPADDWAMVLSNSGIPAGLPPNVKPTDNGYYGMTQQMDSSGNVRGRIFLPTGIPDPNGYYAQAISPLKDAEEEGHLLWEWRYLEGPPYVPVDTEDGGGIPIPPTDLEQRLETIEAQISNHEERLTALEQKPAGEGIQFGDKIALIINSGLALGIVGGGPTMDGDPITLVGKENIHAWESMIIEKGE